MKKRIHFTTVAACITTAFAQSPATPHNLPAAPIQVNRVPAQSPQPTLSQKYDFGGQLRVLEDPMAMDSQKSVNPSVPGGALGPMATGENKVPKDYQPRTDVPLSATAVQAVRVSEIWRAQQNEPASGKDGRVLYAYGAGLPVVVCAPLRVCTIELQPGEKIMGEPQIGDSVRWNVSPALYGQGEDATSVIVLKPQEPGLDTNLLITTDRRAYYIRLVSKPQEYVARVAFSYPEAENNRKWQDHLVAQAQQRKSDAQLTPAIATAERLNFDYKISGGNEEIRPVRVFDDGAKTYIQMRPEIQNRETPALLILGSDGKGEMTNYRVQHQTYIVDRLFDRARLILGAGKKAQKVEITREQQPKG
ncbi:MAG: P-type conjugative transfer protein TrbG [Acidobacteriaceae bacterium]|nr:P-type conjugative transfer protein TrbG [Deltaproteobacteria bacterium]MBV9501047.1 P-type conjugative transfer protein TrbG [Acidobacteriaceae bacterium]